MEFLTKNDIDKCVNVIKKGDLLAFPTETVYGLGAISTSQEAFNKLVETKKRPPNKPFTLMCSSLKQVKDIIEIEPCAVKLIKKYMPGPITLILKTKKTVPHYLDLGTGFVGIRIPNDEFVLKMIDKIGAPLLVPSANISNEPPAMSDEEVYKYFGNSVEIVCGKCDKTIPSTVVKVEDGKLTILREGPISKEELLEAIK